jgi:hypothetical protein
MCKRSNDLGLLQVLVNVPCPIAARHNLAIVPATQHPIVLKQAEVLGQLIPQGLVLVRIREK